jgi:hypothetical protein
MSTLSGGESAALREVAPALPAWAQTDFRIDPWRLPMHVTNGQTDATAFILDRQGATVRKRLSCGLRLSMALPMRAFRGIAARAIETAPGKCRVSLELHHLDPDLCVPLLAADDFDDIAADWHAWSRLLKLPMLIVDRDNLAQPVTHYLGLMMVRPPLQRRKRYGALKHRPWFLRRRKSGRVGEVTRIGGSEIIARR